MSFLTSLRSLPRWQDAIVTMPTSLPYIMSCPGRCGHNAVCIKEDLLIWGGYSEMHPPFPYCDVRVIWNYNLDQDNWISVHTRGESPRHRSGSCSALEWPFWYIFCGHTNDGDVFDMYRLNLITLWWEKVEPNGYCISPRDKASSCVYQNKIYTFQGYGSNPFNSLWYMERDKYTYEYQNGRGWNDQVLYYDIDRNKWFRVESQGPRPSPRAAHSTVCVGSTVYVFGGRHQSERMNDLHRFDLDSHTWSGQLLCQSASPQGRSWHTMSQINKTDLLLYGGFNNADEPLDDVWHLNTVFLSWSLLKRSTGLPRLWHTACVNSHGDILIFGGCINNILSPTTPMETSEHVIFIRIQPFSLERMCLHAVFKAKNKTSSQWDLLPKPFQEWLYEKEKLQMKPPMIKQHVKEVGLGPSLSQLAVATNKDLLQNFER